MSPTHEQRHPHGESDEGLRILSDTSGEIARLYERYFQRVPTGVSTDWCGPDMLVTRLEDGGASIEAFRLHPAGFAGPSRVELEAEELSGVARG